LCTAQLSDGSGSCSASTLPVGSDSVVGTYSGDDNFSTSSGSVEQAVSRAKKLKIATRGLHGGVVGGQYSALLNASGGVAPYHWILLKGVLPAGLTLNQDSGEISGTPTTSAVTKFTVGVFDSALQVHQARRTFSIAVEA